MMKIKQTPRGGSSSHQPRGMATAMLAGAEGEAEQQFTDAPGEETEDSQDWPDIEEGKAGTTKSEGKTGDQPQQAEGGAEVPSEDALPPPDPQPGTSKDPTDASALVPIQDPTKTTPQEPEEETPPDLTEYVKSYQQAGKVWLDTVLVQKEQAYVTLYDRLIQIGDPHIDHLENAVSDQVFNCVRDRTGRCLSKDDFAMYVEKGEPAKKPKYKLTGDAKEALKDYYDTVHTLCKAQANFAESTRVLGMKIEDKSVFLDIIKQVQLPAVKVSVRTIKEEEKLQGKTYREVTLLTHLPNFRSIYPNANEQRRTMPAFMYYVLYEQITGLQKSQTGCAAKFRCQRAPFKRLITGKRQPGGPGMSNETGKSRRKLGEVAEMEGAIPAKQLKVTPKTTGGKG